MTRYAVFLQLERRVFAMMATCENNKTLGIRDPRVKQAGSGHRSVWRSRTGRSSPGSLDSCNVAIRLNPVAGTEICRSLMPRTYVASVASSETAYKMPSESMTDLIRSIQQEDAFVSEKRWLSLQERLSRTEP
jgi:hypothetical protein